ncbi:MAG: hypothetical protein HYS26_02050 [Candidatus Kaiserbacteria bacterium]|nr:MAG: hypothetical protein HYS26_02050 [Candidatus Kaiserbacteria bacterium]
MTPRKLISAAALSLLFAAGAVSAQTTSTTTPGTPNTGLGGDFAQNAIVLATTGAVAIAGIAYLARRTRSV